MGLFYTDNDVMRSKYPEWLQGALDAIIGNLCRHRLVVDVAKSKDMTCQTGTLRSGVLKEAMVRQYPKKRSTYLKKTRRKTPCPDYGVYLTMRLMRTRILCIEEGRLSCHYVKK